jgi:hypothetical protein
VENVVMPGHDGQRSLAIRYRDIASGRTARVGTATFIPSREIAEYFERRGYALYASPTLYPGQTVQARLETGAEDERPVRANLYVRVYRGLEDHLEILRSPAAELAPGVQHTFTWTLPATGGAPIAQVGLEIWSEQRASGTLYLDFLTWDGAPDVVLRRPEDSIQPSRFAGNSMWRRAWVNGVDQYEVRWPQPYRLVQNEGRGLLMQGTRAWTNYEASATVTLHLVKAAGIAVRVQGMRRYYALLLCDDGKARLIKALDGDTVLAEQAYPWTYGAAHEFQLRATDNRLQASIDGEMIFDVEDSGFPLSGGGVAFVVEEGHVLSDAMTVRP